LRAHIVACTGWTWDEAGRLTVPRLNALTRYWARNPPLHKLAASYLGYEAPALDSNDAPAAEEDDGAPGWMSGMGQFPANEAAAAAMTSEEAFKAFERQFFGDVIEL
jgi:hypothetical protein